MGNVGSTGVKEQTDEDREEEMEEESFEDDEPAEFEDLCHDDELEKDLDLVSSNTVQDERKSTGELLAASKLMQSGSIQPLRLNLDAIEKEINRCVRSVIVNYCGIDLKLCQYDDGPFAWQCGLGGQKASDSFGSPPNVEGCRGGIRTSCNTHQTRISPGCRRSFRGVRGQQG